MDRYIAFTFLHIYIHIFALTLKYRYIHEKYLCANIIEKSQVTKLGMGPEKIQQI